MDREGGQKFVLDQDTVAPWIIGPSYRASDA